MAKKQTEIPGTERNRDEDVEAAADNYRAARDERMERTRVEKQRKLELIAVMQARGIRRYKFDDVDGEELEIALDEKLDVSVRKTGEVAGDVGEGVIADADPDQLPAGLLAQAEAAMADSGILVDADGDVTVPDIAAPKSKRGRPRKQKPEGEATTAQESAE